MGELQRLRSLGMGDDNVDMTLTEFVLHANTELTEHVIGNIRAYEAMLTVIGKAAGVIGTQEEIDEVRAAIGEALRNYGASLTDRSQRTSAWQAVGILDLGFFAQSGANYVVGGVADVLGYDEAAEGFYANGQWYATTDPDLLIGNAISDWLSSLWQALKDYWDWFWQEVDENGLLIAVGKSAIDAWFLAAEIAIDIALGALTGGVAAAASIVVRFTAKRVARTATEVVMRASRQADMRFSDAPDLHRETVLDEDIPPDIDRLLDEENLGGGTTRADTDARRNADPDTPTTTVVRGTLDGNTAEWTLVDGVPTRAQGRLSNLPDVPSQRPSEERTLQRTVGGDARLPDDQGGHMVGYRFLGAQGERNLFPQNGNFNMGAYRNIESEWARAIRAGYEVEYSVRLTPEGAARPDRVIVRWQYIDPDGNPVGGIQRARFDNQPGQTYESVNFRDGRTVE